MTLGVLPAGAAPSSTATDVHGWMWTAAIRSSGSRQRRWVREGSDTRARSAAWLIANGYFIRISNETGK